MKTVKQSSALPPADLPIQTNAAVADQLATLAHLLASQGENQFKVRAYRRAAETVRGMADSVVELVHAGADLTQYSGIGSGISAALREIVLNGSLAKVEKLRAEVPPELVALAEYPRLDPKRVLRIYKKLGIGTVAELKERLANGDVGQQCGLRMEQHVRQALSERAQMLLYDAEILAEAIATFLRAKCGVERAECIGDVRRKVEVISELRFLIATEDFGRVASQFQRYGGGAARLSQTESAAAFRLSTGALVSLEAAPIDRWGIAMIVGTGSAGHLRRLNEAGPGLLKLAKSRKAYPTERPVYRALNLAFIEPELREGRDEVERARRNELLPLVSVADIRGDLHAHSTSSDGVHSIEQMVAAAEAKSYDYLGITDHSRSLKIAGGLSDAELWAQIRTIDRMNRRTKRIRILKSAEVDILLDGSLDYPDELLQELDYTICSIHSKFALPKEQQTERIMRAMDNPYFNILGHATGRLLLRRSGYELDVDRLIEHARQAGTHFEINSSPDRLDLSAENARRVREAGIKIAICTDAHSIGELDYIRSGVDQARRAGCDSASILNCLSWPELSQTLRRTDA